MRQRADSYLFPGAFAPILSLDELRDGPADARSGQRFDLTDPDPLADEALQRLEAHTAVNRFVTSLSSHDQYIIRRIFWEDESQSDVAARFKVSRMAISKAMARICRAGRIALIEHQFLAQQVERKV